MTKTITIELRVEDAEPILRKAAETAAKFGAWCDHITRRTYNAPSWGSGPLEQHRKEWQALFLAAKRLVEAFGVDYEPTSEAETLTVDYAYVGGETKVKNLPGLGPVRWRSGSQPDYANPMPSYHRAVHAEACRQAADRVVRAWRASLAA